MQEGFLAERGIAYRTNTFVPGRKTLLFVHGLSGSLSAWYPYETIFEEKYNLITFDLRGHGLSVRPSRRGYAMAEIVEDIYALLKHLRVEHCSIVGHSFGTLIAMEFVRAHPGVAERVVLLSPPYGPHYFRLSHLITNLAAWLAFMPLRLHRYRRTDYAQFYPTGDWSLDRIGADIAHMGLRSYLYSLRVVFARDYTPDWGVLRCPVLIMHGGKDSLASVIHGQALAAILPAATLTILPGANHILVLNNIPEVAAEIEKFVQQ